MTDDELKILTKAGVISYRITHRLEKTIDQRMVARTNEHSWSMNYLVKSEEQEDWKKHILKSPGRFCAVVPRHRSLLGEAVAAHLE